MKIYFQSWKVFYWQFIPLMRLSSRRQQQSDTPNMKTKLIESTLEHKNWTGLTLRELLDLGRVYAGDRGAIMAFVKAANGEPETINALTQYRAAVAGIQSMHGIA